MVLNNPEDKCDLLTYILLPDVMFPIVLLIRKSISRSYSAGFYQPMSLNMNKTKKKKNLNYVFFTVDCV